MPMHDREPPAVTGSHNRLERRLLVLASTTKDGEVASKVLTQAGMDCFVCATPAELLQEIDKGAGALLLVEEVLVPQTLQLLSDAVSLQPNWSDLPILILTHHGANSPLIYHAMEHLGNIQVMERPVRVASMISMVRAALKSRERQYQVRDAQQQVLESEERYRILFNSIDEGFCTIEMLFDDVGKPIDYRFLAVNPAFEKQTGIEHAVGRRIKEIAPEHEEHWFEIYGQIARTGESKRFQYPARAFGRFFNVYAFRIGNPAERQVAVLFNDITESKKAEEGLQLAAAVYKDSSEAMMVTDESNTIITVNQAFTEMTGYQPHEAIGKDPRIL